jgi:hypothetical protein
MRDGRRCDGEWRIHARRCERISGAAHGLQGLLSRFENRGVIIGGIAASLLGTPRLTADVGAVILIGVDDIPRLIREAAKEGIAPRISGCEEFAHKNHVLLLRHATKGTDIDISLGLLPFEAEMVARSQVHFIGPLALRLPAPEDLIILKAVAHRPKDLLDIEALAANHPELDRERAEHWVRQFADAPEMPELWEDVARLL